MTDRYKVTVPKGQRGRWSIERFTVSEDEAKWHSLRCLMGGEGNRGICPGTYTKLVRGRVNGNGGFLGGAVVMSDTQAEIRDHLVFIHQAHGRVLIHGLGLGMCVQAVLAKPEVEHVTVVEKDPDVIALVAPHYACERLTVIEGDALTRKPSKGERWDVVWHDIWDTICADNLPEMHRLHRRYGRRAGWQGSWCRWECERHRRQSQMDRW